VLWGGFTISPPHHLKTSPLHHFQKFHTFTTRKLRLMVPNPVIHIKNLTKFYEHVVGVKDISLDIHQGEIFGFLGPNGAGKTTTIRLLLDLLRPTSGTLSVFGKELTGNSREIRSRCGYLPGNFNAYSNITGTEFLHLCADLRKLPRKIEPGLLERFDLASHNLDRKIKTLSHGTLQKLGIIQAFFHHPELLILDEPTIGLDPLMQEEFYKLLKERQESGSTIFLSSHNLAEVERICHRTAIIRKGVIEKTDSIQNLRKALKKKLLFTLSKPLDDVKLAGTELLKHEGLSYEFVITGGDINLVIKQLAGLPLADLSLPEPGLEEIFIHFYRDSHD
jgi:ABC-2 type transport system ATP-binding protein